MITRVAVELGLMVATFFVANTFWQISKRARFLRRVIADESFLGQFICRRALEDAYASPLIAPFAEKNAVGYFLHLKVLMDADDRSQQRVRVVTRVVLVAILIASWLVGLPYLVITITVFLLCAAVPIAESAKSNALQQVLAIALILYKWREENAVACEHWIRTGELLGDVAARHEEHEAVVGKASSLLPLYNVVTGAQ